MKSKHIILSKTSAVFHKYLWIVFFMISSSPFLFGQTLNYFEIKGQVIDVTSNKPIPDVHFSIENTNVSGVTNNNGVFSLKIPKEFENVVLRFFKINYKPISIPCEFFNEGFATISLTPTTIKIEELEEVALYRATDPKKVVALAFENQMPTPKKLVAFYREKIDKGSRNVLLGEAVIQIDLDKKIHGRKGAISIYKSRKRTDYNRLDTLSVKLRGGPYSVLHLDLATYPESLFSNLDAYTFNFKEPTIIDKRFIYSIYFEEIDKSQPWYFGEMHIDAKTNALVKINFGLNVDDRRAAAKMLVIKKPKRAKVTPLGVNYLAEYIEKDGRWYFNYGEFLINLRINWKGKLFNSRYAIQTELAITDRSSEAFFSEEDLTQIKPTVVMTEDVIGFEDPEFWGINNTIHPDKNLQEVIKTIQDKIKKEK